MDWNELHPASRGRILVVPYIGTWIETIIGCKCDGKALGRTLYRYVDWNRRGQISVASGTVVPYIGTWIETQLIVPGNEIYIVVPYIGTWIETKGKNIMLTREICRTLYRYVDWNQKSK